MSPVSARDRFLGAARGLPVDRPPVGAWIHHHSAYWPPADTASAHVRFQTHYDWDFVKVMHDYRLALPDDLEEVTTREDLQRVANSDQAYPNFDAQRETVTLIRAAFPDVALVETVFSPIQTLVRALGASVVDLLRADDGLGREVIGRVTGRLVEYVRQVADLDVDAVFLAVTGAGTDESNLGLSPRYFADVVAPSDRAVLNAAEGMVRIIHLHGANLDTGLVADYPAEVLSWSDRISRPTIGEVAASSRIPMGGFDEIASLYWTPSQVRADVLRSRRQAEDRIIVAPNCTLHSDAPPAALRALRAAVEVPLD